MFRFALLGSGSEGNALAVQAGATSLLMDCGFSLNETLLRLERLQIRAEQLDGILVTHEHGDHIAGVAKLSRKFDIPVWMTHGTLRSQKKAFFGLAVTEINPHAAFTIGDIEVQPYLVPHDAAEPVQYVFGNGQNKLGVLTDAGHITPHIEATLCGCRALVLECNHDTEMLRNSRYPPSLKQRVGGHLGHLSNHQAAQLLARLNYGAMQHVVAAHLSRNNNLAELAVAALGAVPGFTAPQVAVATQEEGSAWREIL